MVQQPLKVRRAEQDDIAFIVDLSRRVQEKLTASGSLQQIGPIPRETVEAQVNAGTAHILDGGSRRLGSVFVEPVTVGDLERWKLDDPALKPWFLHKLMLEPGEQGHGLGAHFLRGIKAYVASRQPGAIIVLDCWAGNDKLRDFYTRAGFKLQGVFPANGFEVAVFVYRTRKVHTMDTC
jgi:GNAT superfamily N-acetyltransferase